MEQMNIFGSVQHNDDNTDTWPSLCTNPTTQDILDYVALITARFLDSEKAFKGGYMLNQLLGEDSRMTHDIDFSIANKEAYEEVKTLLCKLGDYFVSHGLASEYKIKENIAETSSGGITIYDNDGKTLVGVDVGLHSLLYGTKRFNINIGDVEAFSIERMLSDKLLAILSRKRFRRTKDLYDFYVLVSKFDFSYQELANCIDNRDNYDPSVWDNIPFSEEVLTQYLIAWNKLQLISSKDGSSLSKPLFEDALALFNKIAFRLKYREPAVKWNHIILNWEV